jgi:hypothetical protein
MSVAKILKQQSAWLQQATKTIVLNRPTEAEAKFPEEVRKRRRAQIEARIAMLETQRKETAKRFEAAIAEAKQELEQLGPELDLRPSQAEAGAPPQEDGASQSAGAEAPPKATKRRATRAKR